MISPVDTKVYQRVCLILTHSLPQTEVKFLLQKVFILSGKSVYFILAVICLNSSKFKGSDLVVLPVALHEL